MTLASPLRRLVVPRSTSFFGRIQHDGRIGFGSVRRQQRTPAMRKDEVEYANRPWRRMVRIGTWGVVGLCAYWSVFQRDLSGYADENGENVFTEVREFHDNLWNKFWGIPPPNV
eukprot:TRINITY_DN7225_c0_g1_i1.p1 TRINITY_DN7225_c0_g1~~TRINITY_DN7225_c0_g1_i1.p1  ORF type:complete len:114 (-),score=5.04 TRINITY_DN7225_c0_g1_i1:278-619(-)